jgi:hypothetical protein
MKETYFDGMASLVTSKPDQNIETIMTSVLYGNSHSLIINRNDCDVLLHRLIRLSSIRELTLSDTIHSTSFINLLNIMTGLESLRLMEESQKILLSLKDNRSLIQCLQKRAIRKLFLRNHYSIKDIKNKTPFPIDEFIQVFGHSLEYLYWRKPPVAVPTEAIINGLTKLKNLTIIKNSNKNFSTYELTQWMQEKTRLTTFVVKCEKGIDGYIWHFWF